MTSKNEETKKTEGDKPLAPADVRCRKTKATRTPIIGHDSDWIIEEKTNIFLGSVGRGIQTDIYPYNEIFEIQVGI